MICYSPWSRNRKLPIEKPGGGFYNQCMSLKRFIPVFLIFSLLSGCFPRPAAERDSVMRVPLEQEVAWGEEAYREILKKEKISQDRQLIEIVERVGRQLAAVSPMPNLRWEFKLIESDKKNAVALPGGKVAVYTGILPVCANEAGLAAVMSHDIAHAIARHGVQRTPFSRDHEAEADEVGMMLMAKAGYDPREAGHFWDRFHKIGKGSRPPGILFTHPTDAARIQDIRRRLPRANRVYQANPLKHGLGESFLYILSRRQMKQNSKSVSPPSNPGASAPIPGPK